MKRLLLVGRAGALATAGPNAGLRLGLAVATLAERDVGRDPARAPIAGGVYIGAQDNKLYALDAVTGATLWMQTTGDQVSSSATVANGVVDVGSYDGNVYAFTLP
jgi:outer membrane protein assembly factor BamB